MSVSASWLAWVQNSVTGLAAAVQVPSAASVPALSRLNSMTQAPVVRSPVHSTPVVHWIVSRPSVSVCGFCENAASTVIRLPTFDTISCVSTPVPGNTSSTSAPA